MSVLWSPDFDAYASGEIAPEAVRCVLCLAAPCVCPPFGTPEYFTLLDVRHGRRPATRTRHEARATAALVARLDEADSRRGTGHTASGAPYCRTCGFADCPRLADGGPCPRWPS